MLRLLNIELFKLRHSKYFWWLTGLFAFFLLSVPIGARMVLVKITEMGAEIRGIGMDDLPLFDFVDIWQNLTWFYSMFSIFPAFIVIISVCNEYSYGTIKQNVIDGLSRKEFLLSKVMYILASSIVITLVVGLIGLGMGLVLSDVKSLYFITKNIHFLGAYFLQLVLFQLFALLMALLIKRSGIAIVLTLFYTYLIEPIAGGIVAYKFDWDWFADILPIRVYENSIKFPFSRYAFFETQNYIAIGDFLLLIFYLALFTFLSFRIITRKDLA